MAASGTKELIGDAEGYHEWGFQSFGCLPGVEQGPVIVGALIAAHPVEHGSLGDFIARPHNPNPSWIYSVTVFHKFWAGTDLWGVSVTQTLSQSAVRRAGLLESGVKPPHSKSRIFSHDISCITGPYLGELARCQHPEMRPLILCKMIAIDNQGAKRQRIAMSGRSTRRKKGGLHDIQ
jgi:hypothetical protein